MRGQLSWKRCEEIKILIVEMFEECEVHRYPLDPFYIAERLCYIVRPYSELCLADRLDALDISDDGYSQVEQIPGLGFRYVIYYNDLTLSEGRIRWTLFHEIGHCYLGHHDNPDDELSSIEEQEANFFAKIAIAPPVLIYKLNCDCPSAVAHRFETSLQAADYIFVSYQKWLTCSPYYTEYEMRLLRMFGLAA